MSEQKNLAQRRGGRGKGSRYCQARPDVRVPFSARKQAQSQIICLSLSKMGASVVIYVAIDCG